MEKERIVSNFNERAIVKVCVAALLALAVVAVAWAGGKAEPWKAKPYTEWDQNDLKLILNKSPWAKLERVEADWKPEKGGPESAAVPPAGGMPVNRPYDAGNASGPAMVYFAVRWNSSRTVREALVRDAILSGKMKESDAGKYLSAPITDYEVLVVGPDMTPFQHATPDELKAKSSLRGQKSKVEVHPTNVNMVRSPAGGRVTAVVFSFPLKTADSKDVAATQEKGLRFECKLKDISLSTTFDPRKMADAKGPDF